MLDQQTFSMGVFSFSFAMGRKVLLSLIMSVLPKPDSGGCSGLVVTSLTEPNVELIEIIGLLKPQNLIWEKGPNNVK